MYILGGWDEGGNADTWDIMWERARQKYPSLQRYPKSQRQIRHAPSNTSEENRYQGKRLNHHILYGIKAQTV